MIRIAVSLVMASCGLLDFALAASPEEDHAVSTEVLVVTGDHAERWQVTASLEGIDLADARSEIYEQLHAFYDSNSDGKLSLQEARLLPTPFGMRQLAAGRVLPAIAPPPDSLDVDHDQSLTVSELKAYYIGSQPTGCQVTYGRSPLNSTLTKSILQAMQLSDQAAIDEALLEKACRQLLTYDANGDGLISPGELIPGEKYPGTNATRIIEFGNERTQRDLFISLLPSSQQNQIELLFRQLDSNHDRLLVTNELELRPTLLEALPVGSDDAFDLGEWESWYRQLPVRTWHVALSADRTKLTGANDSSVAKDPIWFKSSGQWLRVHSEHVNHLAARKHLAELVSQCKEVSAAIQGELNQESLKAIANHTELTRFITLVDADRNQQVSAAELAAWQSLVEHSLQSQCVLSLIDFETSLFALLDENFDGSLAEVELSQAWQRLSDCGVISQGELQLAHMPRQWRGIVANGVPRKLLDRQAGIGPHWFRSMDRNHDGIVSPAEFLAGEEAFAELDKDHDRLLRPEELPPK